jgi:hypothetical protein
MTRAPSRAVVLAVAHPLAVVGDVVVPVGSNYVTSLTAIDPVPPVAIAHVYEVTALLGLHAVSVPPEALGKDVVGCSPADDEVVERRFKERVVICLKAFRDLTATTETLKDGCRRRPGCNQQRWEPAPASR